MQFSILATLTGLLSPALAVLTYDLGPGGYQCQDESLVKGTIYSVSYQVLSPPAGQMALTVPNPINNVTPKNLLYTSGNGGSAFITSDITGTVQFCVKNNYVSTSISGQVTVAAE